MDLIEREEAIAEMHLAFGSKPAVHAQAVNVLNSLPSAEKTGKWENIDIIHIRKDAKITDWQQAQCSVCGKWQTKPYLYGIDLDPYCPSCGSRMVE